jgi:hypothetical protein
MNSEKNDARLEQEKMKEEWREARLGPNERIDEKRLHHKVQEHTARQRAVLQHSREQRKEDRRRNT